MAEAQVSEPARGRQAALVQKEPDADRPAAGGEENRGHGIPAAHEARKRSEPIEVQRVALQFAARAHRQVRHLVAHKLGHDLIQAELEEDLQREDAGEGVVVALQRGRQPQR